MTLFRMGFFRDCSRIVGKMSPFPKICLTYPAIMKLGTVIPYLKKIKKNILITWNTAWVLLTSALFYHKSGFFIVSRNTDIDCIWIHNLKFFLTFFLFKTFFESLKVFSANMVVILMMSAILAALDLLKVK